MAYNVPHLINGQKISTKSRELAIYNPAKGEAAGQINVATAEVVKQAVKAAKDAFPAWAATTPNQRSRILFQFRSLLIKHREELARLITQEHGKTHNEALGSLQRGFDVVDYTCGITNHLKGSFTADLGPNIDTYDMHQPLGVCAGITPFNFPAMIPLWMFPMAIACGNTFILKPSEKDPSCAQRMVELLHEAGLPNGVVNVIHGDKETVDAILHDPDIKAVSFVGSSDVAQYVHHTAAAQNKRVQAFGGAKNHCIVMPDADMDIAADALVTAAYDCAGERCMAISAILAVGEQTADELIERMLPKIKALKIGDGNEKDVMMGPLITQAHWERVQSYIAKGKEEGASLLLDGSHYKPENAKTGFFMGTSLFDHVKPEMTIYKDEIFGPVLSVLRLKAFEEALTLVNEHQYGNGTAIFTRDGYTARQFASRVQAGMVGINVPVPVPVAWHSFGGWKRSIFSDIGMYGSEGIRFYTRLKTVTQRWYPAGSTS